MCEAKPAPRCSAHALKNLVAAVKSGDKKRIQEAQREYSITAAFTKQVRANAHKTFEAAVATAQGVTDANEEGAALQKASRELNRKLKFAANQDAERRRLKDEAARVRYASDPAVDLPTISALIECPTEPWTARFAAVRNLHARAPFFGTFSVDEVASMFGVPTRSKVGA
jgi:aminoglycoside phosphotransferase